MFLHKIQTAQNYFIAWVNSLLFENCFYTAFKSCFVRKSQIENFQKILLYLLDTMHLLYAEQVLPIAKL